MVENAKKIADYQNSLAKNSSKEINVNNIWQNLVLADEPDAKLAVQWSKNASGIITQNTGNAVLYADGDRQDGQTAKFNGSQNGTIATATWTNLKNSYYIDSNGIKHTIGKLVRIYSDLKANGQNNNNPFLKVYRNPYLNAATYFASDITAQYFMYDTNGSLLSIDDGTGWLGISSLNNYDGVLHVEAVKALQNAKLYELTGAYKNATIHSNGYAYEDLHDPQYTGVKEASWGGFIVAKISNGAKFTYNLNSGHNANYTDDGKHLFQESVSDKYWWWWDNWNQFGVTTDLISGKPQNVTPPTPPTIHYHHTNVALVLELNLIM